MSFNINCNLENYEYRGYNEGVGKSGPWYSLILENPDNARQLDVSVPNDLQGEVQRLGLHKGDKLTISIVAVSTSQYSFVRLVKVLQVVDSDGEVQF